MISFAATQVLEAVCRPPRYLSTVLYQKAHSGRGENATDHESNRVTNWTVVELYEHNSAAAVRPNLRPLPCEIIIKKNNVYGVLHPCITQRNNINLNFARFSANTQSAAARIKPRSGNQARD